MNQLQRWISARQQQRDHDGLRNTCSACGHHSADLVLTTDGVRVCRAHTADPRSGLHGREQS